jgi:hypothetical protein
MVNSKAKGSQFEREVCKLLSRWVSHGKRDDCFWRSAMSGGRATVAKRKGTDIRQTGDICAVSPEGHALTDIYFIECKFYKDLKITSFILDNKGPLAKFWKEACKKAGWHNHIPMLIAKENNRKILIITEEVVPNEKPLIRYLHDVLKNKFDVWTARNVAAIARAAEGR